MGHHLLRTQELTITLLGGQNTVLQKLKLGTLHLIWGCVLRFPQFFLSNCWVQLPHCLFTIPHGLAPATSSLCRLSWQSEFLLMLWPRQSPFVKDGWGLTYTNKTREAHGLGCWEAMLWNSTCNSVVLESMLKVNSILFMIGLNQNNFDNCHNLFKKPTIFFGLTVIIFVHLIE
jgi:hypothetical protein